MNLHDEEMFQCAICCNDVDDASEIYQVKSCHCRFCRECVRQYSNNQVNIATIRIHCPARDCNAVLTPDEIRSLLTDMQFYFYNKRLLNHDVANDPQRLFCPHADCDYILTVPAEQEERTMTCPKCQHTCCLQCGGPWHPNERCPPSLTSCEKDSDANIKQCPRCRFPLERVAGCAQIVCMNCKHMFCWHCLKSLENDFFLLHYQRGPCRDRLGHPRTSVFFHRLMMVGLFVILVILLIVTSPLLLLMLPCLICYGRTPMRNYFYELTEWEPRSMVPRRSVLDLELQSMTLIASSANTGPLDRFGSTQDMV